MKKISSVILLIAMLAGLFCLTVQADGIESTRDAIAKALPGRVEILDVSAYNVTVNEVTNIISQLGEHEPFAFLLKSASYQYNPKTNFVTKLNLIYHNSASDHKAIVDFINKKTNEYIKAIPSSCSSVDKLIYIHELLIKNTKYDSTYKSNTVYSLFKTNTATCQAYSMAFMHICRTMGFEVDTVTSVEMNHMWNKIKVNGKWYNVDVTHDDPTSDRALRATHDHFLCSDEKFQELGHSGFSSNSCNDTKYDNAFWNSTKGLMVYNDSHWIYVDNKEGAMYSGALEEESEQLFVLEKNWKTGYSTWPDCYTGEGIIDGKVIYNTHDTIMSYDPETEVHSVLYIPQLGSKEQIFGLYCEDNTVYYVVGTDPNGKNDDVRSFVLDDSLPKYFTITFTFEGEIISQETVKEGEVITAPSTQPTKSSTSSGSYVFKGWNGYTNGMKASSNSEFEAVFEFVANSTAKPTTSTAKPTTSTAKPTTSTAKPTTKPTSSTAKPTVTNPKPTESTVKPTASTKPSQTVPPATSAVIPENSTPGSSSEITPPASTSIPAAPATTVIAAPQSTTIAPTTTQAPNYSYTGLDQSSPTHNIPQKSTIAVNNDQSGAPSATGPEPTHSEGEENQGAGATPWIIAGGGSAAVVGGIVLKEMVIAPKLAQAKLAKIKISKTGGDTPKKPKSDD